VSDDDDDDDETELRSRGDLSRERKADEKRLAALAKTLAGLSSKQLSKLELDEGVADAVDELSRIRSHAARGRQLRIVRRELRGSDHVAIATAIDEMLNPDGRPTPAAYEAGRWAARFLADGNDAVEEFVVGHEQADRQRLKGLLRNARRADASKSTKARKALVAAIQPHIKVAGD
jgi:ribosome-associated protein